METQKQMEVNFMWKPYSWQRFDLIVDEKLCEALLQYYT